MYNKLVRRGIRNKENDKTYNELPVDHFNILKVIKERKLSTQLKNNASSFVQI